MEQKTDDETESQRETIVVIDDDYAMRLSCRQILSKSGFQVETYEDGTRGLEGVARARPALVVVDLKMPGISGIEVISRLHNTDPYIVLVVITGYATIGTAVEAIKAGAYDFLPKPFKPDELRMIVQRGVEHRRLLLDSRRSEIERELMKRRFVTFVAHELKTPLVAIHQYLDVLKQLGDAEEAEAKRQEWLERCLRRSEEMQGLIADWLTLARMESETLSRRKISVDLGQIVPGILKSYEDMAAELGVSLNADVPKHSYMVRGDPNCVTVLLDNLIVNAIKYNKRDGKVTVSVDVRDGDVVISIVDTGLGIPVKYRECLFDEFFRIKGDGAEASTGSGLGLPICKRIVSEMGGNIEVESEEMVGSTFRVRLPVYRGEAESSGPEEVQGEPEFSQDTDRR